LAYIFWPIFLGLAVAVRPSSFLHISIILFEDFHNLCFSLRLGRNFIPKLHGGIFYLRQHIDPDTALLASWWDYGYASLLLNRVPTLVDGGSQTSPKTYFLARALLAPSQQQTATILRDLTPKNTVTQRDIYLVLTDQMMGWMPTISQIAHWDTTTGRPTTVAGNAHGTRLAYARQTCTPIPTMNSILCNDQHLNLDTGTRHNRTPLAGYTIATGGHSAYQQRFDTAAYDWMQWHQLADGLVGFEIHKSLYESSYHQLFTLGNVAAGPFEMVFDDFPHMRVFRLAAR